MYYPMYFDPTYILIIIGVLLSLAASTKVKSTFSRYSGVRSLSGLTGAQTAERILHQAGIYDVGIARISGDLTDKNRAIELFKQSADNGNAKAAQMLKILSQHLFMK